MGEAHPAGGVAGPRPQVLAVVGHQGHAHAWNRPRRLQRAHHRVQAVRAGVGGDGHVGEHDPAAGLGRLLAGVLFAGLEPPSPGSVPGLDHIAARAQRLQHRAQREDGGGLLGQVAVDLERALPDHMPLVVGAGLVVGGIVALAGRVGLDDLAAHQVAVGHAPDLDGQAGDVYGVDAHAVGILARQDHPVAGEPHIGRLVGGREVDVLAGGQRLAGSRGQAFQQGDLAVREPQPADAELIAARHDRRGALDRRGDQHEVGVAPGRVQLAGHLDAVDRLGVGGVDAPAPDRETVGLLVAGTWGVGRPRVAEQGPEEAGLLARDVRLLAGMPGRRPPGQQEAQAEAKQQRARDGSRENLLIPIHGERFPGRRRAPEKGSSSSGVDQLAREALFTFSSPVARLHQRCGSNALRYGAGGVIARPAPGHRPAKPPAPRRCSPACR